MVDENLKIYLNSRDKKYNFSKLLKFLEESGIPFKSKKLITGGVAIATIQGVLFDLEQLIKQSDKLVFFILLHEVGHSKRLSKIGIDKVVGNLSEENFEVFFSKLIYEELVADRYASFLFNIFNEEKYPWYETQQLDLETRQNGYRPVANLYFGKISNDINKYNQLLNKFIIG